MGLRVRKRIKVCKGLHLNVSKSGISASAKVGNMTVNSRGRVTASIPGTGISYSTNLKKNEVNKRSKTSSRNAEESKELLEKQKEEYLAKKEELRQSIHNFKNSVPDKVDAYRSIESIKRDLMLSKVSAGLSIVLCVLSFLIMLINILLGVGLLVVGLLLNKGSRMNIKKYKIALQNRTIE